MKNVFEKKIGEIFGSALYSATRRGKSDYTETEGTKSLSFMISGGCSFEQLEKLSILLGTKNINYVPDYYDEYFGEWDATINVYDVNFSQVK